MQNVFYNINMFLSSSTQKVFSNPIFLFISLFYRKDFLQGRDRVLRIKCVASIYDAYYKVDFYEALVSFTDPLASHCLMKHMYHKVDTANVHTSLSLYLRIIEFNILTTRWWNCRWVSSVGTRRRGGRARGGRGGGGRSR